MRARRVAAFLLAIGIAVGQPSRTAAEPVDRHLVYVELLGKGGLGGVGYEYRIAGRWLAGAVASFYVLDGDRVLSLSPYAAVDILRRRAHAWFAHAGPQLVHVWTPSPVPEWSGRSATGIGAEVSTGYELRTRIVLRVFVEGCAGKGGVAPWFGLSGGWAF